MDGTVASQIQVIKSHQRGGSTDRQSSKRPVTRPSILFDPKEAADIDLRTILRIAISGLDALAELDSRYRRYKDSLFNDASLDIDREKMVPSEEKRINKSISSYLRLLTGHLHFASALKTLEYLIRRFQIHVFNVNELVLCALPYHETHAFVKIVQLIDLRNKIWGFLEASQTSGASPPRKVIAQQCLNDKAVLEAICDYASPTNKFCHPKSVTAFLTVVIIEALGSAQKLDDETIRRVLPFVFNSLNPEMKGDREAKAGALMIAGLLSSRTNLAPKLVHSLLFFTAQVAQQDSNKSSDLPWVRTVLMAIITIIQSQSLHIIPEKTLKILVELRDLSGILGGLSKDFNIENFTSLYFQTLADRSLIDNVFCSTLISSLKNIPAKMFVGSIVLKVLKASLKILQNKEGSYLHEAGARAKQIFMTIHDNYNSEFQVAIENFFLNSKKHSTEEDSMLNSLCLMFDGGLDIPFGSSYSKLWFSLHHPKACVRQATLSSLSSSGVLKANSFDQQLLVDLKETIIRQLHDDDLAIVQAALSVEELSMIISPPDLLKVIEDVLCRCMSIISTSTSNIGTASEVAELCLRTAIKLDTSRKFASMLFPLLLVLPKTWNLNLTAVELAKVIQWPFYSQTFSSLNIFKDEFSKLKMLEQDHITALNLHIVEAIAQSFIQDPKGYIEWLCECSKKTDPSKCLLLLIILRSIYFHKEDVSNLFMLFEVCFSVVKDEWQAIASKDNLILCKELTEEAEDKSLEGCMNKLLSSNFLMLNAKVVVCICWAFLEAFAAGVPNDNKVDDHKSISMLENLFIFFTSTSAKEVFKVHLFFLLKKCSDSPLEFLSRFYTDGGFPLEVQVESLISFASVCSAYSPTEINLSNTRRPAEFLVGSPSLLVPLSHPRKDVRAAALSCVEALQNLCTTSGGTRTNNGNDEQLIHSTSASLFGRFWGFICEQKRLILSDVNCVKSLLTSMLGRSSKSLLVPQSIDKRFDQHAKDTILLCILNSALRLPSCAKLSLLSLLEGTGSSILWINEVKSLVSELLERRRHHFIGFPKGSTNRLSESEIETLCILLKISIEVNDQVDPSCVDYLIEALKVDGSLSDDDPAVVKPCLSALRVLTSSMYGSLGVEKQDEIFANLIFLVQNGNSDVKSAAKEILLQINVNYLCIVKFIKGMISDDGSASRMKRKKASSHHSFFFGNLLNGGKMPLCLLNSLLNFLILKKDLQNRKLLVASLFNLLKELFSDKFCKISVEEFGASSGHVEILITDAQQATLNILEDICTSSTSEISVKDKLFSAANVNLLIECAQCTENAETRNHIFLLLVAIANISSEYVSECMQDLVSVIARAATKQTGGHSQHVLERVLSILVPCWIPEVDGIKGLLQVFTNILPEITESRRLPLMVYLLRIIGEKCSLGTFLAHLFRSLVSRKSSTSDWERCLGDLTFSTSILKEWEFLFAEEICNQFSCNIWLSSFITLLEEIGNGKEHDKHKYEMLLVLHFIMQKLHATELIYELEYGEQVSHLQWLLGSIMEKVVLQKELGKTKCATSIHKKRINEAEAGLLKVITDIMVPSQYYKSITMLLDFEDVTAIKKTLGFLSETLKSGKLVARRHNHRFKQLDSREAFDMMCYKLIQLVDEGSNELLASVKLPALSSLEILVNKFISDENIFISSLRLVLKNISSNDLKVSSCCLRCVSVLIKALGSKALPELHDIMGLVLEKATGNCRRKNDAHYCGKIQLSISVLMILEAIVENLSCFLSPFLEKIIALLVLDQEYGLESDHRIKSRASVVRKLIVEKIQVRITLKSIFKIYPRALESGEASLCLVFEMLVASIGSMDKSSVLSWYTSLFDHCLLALDLRRQRLESIKSIASVEEYVVRAISILTLKLTESIFRPLFLRALEWAESDVVADDMTCMSVERNISFYNLVNKLAEEQRSLFVPYFKYLRDGCIYHLSGDQSKDSVSRTHKQKKARIGQEFSLKEEELLTPQKWHLRALVLASLYKCFLYDTGNLKFLNNTNFQILLKPIVSQLVAEPPVFQGYFPDIPTIEEVDKSLVCCLGHMAIAVGSDDAWKQLNHEVLMQTRSEKTRPRILGLKVLKFLLDHLKEEYLVLLPETIPFLGELLEDTEPSVKSLAQEVFKELERYSGENLQQYL